MSPLLQLVSLQQIQRSNCLDSIQKMEMQVGVEERRCDFQAVCFNFDVIFISCMKNNNNHLDFACLLPLFLKNVRPGRCSGE